MDKEKIRELKAAFSQDLIKVCESYHFFKEHPEYDDEDGDAYDIFLDLKQNLFVDWVIKRE